VGGKPAEFAFDPLGGLIHGQITFSAAPVSIELVASPDGRNLLTEKVAPCGPALVDLPRTR
jgi:hypothetical protein